MLYIVLIVFAVVSIWGAYGVGRAKQWKIDVTCMDYNELRKIVGDDAEDVWNYHFQRMIEVSPKD